MTLVVTSTAFQSEQRIPQQHTGDGADRSPPLVWSGIPAGTEELALICDDPDAPRADPWVHWVLYGIPTTVHELPEGIPAHETLTSLSGIQQGLNDFHRVGYGGPAPPRGHGTHHYYFTLYALDTHLDLPPRATKSVLLAAMEGHVLARGGLVGTYSR